MVSLKEPLDEDLTMLYLFIARERTPKFRLSARSDGVMVSDMGRATLFLRHSTNFARSSLDGGGRGGTGGRTLTYASYICCRGRLTAASVSRPASSRPTRERTSAGFL